MAAWLKIKETVPGRRNSEATITVQDHHNVEHTLSVPKELIKNHHVRVRVKERNDYNCAVTLPRRTLDNIDKITCRWRAVTFNPMEMTVWLKIERIVPDEYGQELTVTVRDYNGHFHVLSVPSELIEENRLRVLVVGRGGIIVQIELPRVTRDNVSRFWCLEYNVSGDYNEKQPIILGR